MPADIIVYALVAAGLIFWLRSILGTRHGDEKSRPNIYTLPTDEKGDPVLDGLPLEAEQLESAEDKIAELAKTPVRGMGVENKAAESGLIEIAQADKDFDIEFFLEGAQEAFVIIVESFAEGDRETLKDLLSSSVYSAFDSAITEREKKEETVETEIHAIKKAEIIEAKLDKKKAFITVRVTADETSVTKDSEGSVIAGHPDKVTEMRDVWVFSRTIRSRDPRWLLEETRGDFDGDNEMIPNSDE